MPSQRLLLSSLLLILMPISAGAFPFLDEFKGAADAIGGISGVISGASGVTMDIAETVEATNDLASELGEDTSNGTADPAMKATIHKMGEVREAYSEAGYSEAQIDGMLDTISTNQASVAKKLRSLRRTIHAIKSYQQVVSKLFGPKGSEVGLNQTKAVIDANNLHQGLLDNQMMTNGQLDQHLLRAREESSYKHTLVDHFESTFKRLQDEEEASLLQKSPLKLLKKKDLMEIVWEAFVLMIVVCGFCIASVVFTEFGFKLLKLSFVAGLMIVLLSSINMFPRLWGVS